MSAKVSAVDSGSGHANSAAATPSTSAAATNGNSTPARRLRTRTSTGGNVSGSDSAKKNNNNNTNGPLAERTNYASDSNANVGAITAAATSTTPSGGCDEKAGASSTIGGSAIASSGSSGKKYHNSCPHPTNPGNVSGRKAQNHSQPHSSSTFNMNKNEEFHFDTPVECPVFRPTQEEFKNPLAYISKIRPIAEKCGIAKILPPESWSPPFAVDVDKLKFTPRVQRLNELEAKTRVKLNFLDQIAKFWELQGSSLKIPMVERKALDLYTLHRIVQEEGGMEQTTKERKWAKVANRMSYPSSKSVGATLKAHYERILHPFEVYTSGKVLGGAAGAAATTASAESMVAVKMEDGTDYKAHEIPTRQQIAPPNENNARRSKRFANSSANCGLGGATRGHGSIKVETKEDFKRDLLHCFNAASSSSGSTGRSGVGNSGNASSQKKAPDPQLVDPLMKYICHICNRGDVEESMLLCDGCDDSYHTFCLLPPLSSIPKGEWLCPRCVVEEVSKPTEAFGFEQAEREYTLQQFGQMADQFKMDYFRKPVHLVPTDLVEREFWRIVSSIDEDVTVEYGADLHTMDHGSGFPTKSSLYLLPGDQEYAESSWNLNNLPLLEDSILGHINADISGMNAPWMYVGMCFAAFCWHNEDHWSYSINYLHWGEPKTWYGVPGSCAEQFEETMKQAAPELFASQPDLLHQLVTIMNPNILMNNGVPVFRTDQNAGEFVITFPRAYHAGFNQGYNFAEAVNFAPADWLKMGRECVNHYSMLRRFCVFSHDELVCKMALEPAKLTFGIATACYIDMAEMVDSEKKLRKSLLEWGVTRAERKAFELVPDDERHCQECNTTCFLSAVACECKKAIVCLRHYTVLCDCPPEKHTLLYRYTLDEMPLMLQKLKAKAQSFERWLSRCRDIVDANTPTSVTLTELQELCKEAEMKKFPSSLLIDRLNAAVLEAEKCVTVIQQLGINKVRTRSDNNLEAAQYKLTMEELELFVQEIDNLCCIIEEGASVRELLVLGKQFVERSNAMLKRALDTLEEPEMEMLISDGNSLRIELHQMQQLNMRLKQLKWYKRSQGMRNASTKLTYVDIKNLLSAAAGEVAPSDPIIDKEIRKLQEIGASIEAWEKQAARYFRCNTQQHELIEIEQFLKTAADIDGQVPSYVTLKDALRKAKEWLRSVEQLQANGHFPYCHTLEAIVQRGRNIPIQLEELSRMQGHLNSAHEWKENTGRVFLKKDTFYTLLEVLMPRSDPVIIDSDLKKPFEDDFVREMNPAQIVDSFKEAESKELRDMRELRRQNMGKNPLRDDYCLCKSPFQGVMYNCQLCRDWFHEDCVPPPNTSSALNGFNGKPKWLCSSCVRSKRPSLESILPLLVSLQRLPIRLPEDEALRCLAERAMNWQERARKVLTSSDVAAAMEAITAHQRKQKRKNASILPVQARKPRRGSHRNSKDAVTSDNPDTTDDDEEGRLHIVEDGFSNDEDETCDEVAAATAELQKLLPDFEMENLAELMMEGDLLEVSLEDTQTLWRILSMVQPAGASEAAALVKQHQLLQQKQHAQPASSVNSAAEDSNDSLLVQSSPNSNSGSASGRNSSNANKKRRSLDPNGGCTVPRKKTATPNKQPSSVIKKSTRKLQENSKQQPQPDDIGENYTPSKQANGATSGVNAGAQSAQKKRKRVGTNANNNAAGGTGGQKKHSQRTQTAQQEDDEEECRAENCHKPTGREVDWVQCDGGCNEWFHMYCVGLNRSQIKADDDYICIRCSKTVAVAAVITGGSNGNSVPAASITTTTTTTLVGNSNSSGVGGAVAAVTQQAQATPSVKGRTQAARLCKSPFQGVMYNCQLCRDWFHEDCVPPPNTSSALNGFNGKPKWLCSSCVRSKRPSLESILPLLVSLQRLPIRLPEDEALRCLAERAMNWQERARKVLTSSDVAAAMEAITAHQRKQKRKNASILPVQARKPRRGSHRNSKDAVTSDNPDTTDDDEEGRLHIVEDGFSNDEDETCDEVAAATAELQKLLPDFEMENLAELMMEGDLLEVSLEDTQTLWRILSMVQPAGASEAAALVKQHQLLQQKQHAQPASSVNSAAEDSNDSLLVQSSPNSNSGSASGRNSSNANKKRRSLDPNGGCTVPRKKTATPNKQPSSVIKKSTRKLQENSKQQPQPDDIGENYTPSKQANGATSGVNAGAQSAQKKRKRVGTNANNNAAGGTGGQKKHSQRTQTAQQEDDEEECRAENCHKPTGREVDWVQCDGGCNEWFHMYCVGLNRSQIKADDDYICIRCSKTVAVAAVITGGSNGNSVPAASITTTTTTTLVGNSNSSGVGGAVAAVTQQAQATPSVKGRTQAARLCKSPFQGVMYNCQLCRDWFHEDCVPPPNTSSALNGFNGKPKWLCSSCVRSKRPSLESILPLLVSLQRLPIRLPEDEALRCLAERAMNWQERARKVLTSSDVAAAMEAITAHQRKQKRKNASILPVQARKPRRGSHRNSKDAVTSDNPDTTDDDEEGRLHIVEDGFSNDEDETCDEVAAATAELQKLLPDFEMENLAELMMEGDLLEVSLEDTQTLWRILSMVQPAGASEAAALVKQHQLLQQKQHAQPASSVNSAAEDSNDSLLVQSSPNSNSGSASGRNSSNANKKRRSLDPNGGCTVPRKKTATPNKQPSSVIKKSTRKLQENSKQQPQPDDIGENYTPSKQANGATSGVNAGAQSAQKKRKRVGTNANNNAAGGTGGQKKHSQRTQTAQQEDDEEECRAENCHKPTGREVDWVQCDGGCNEWFHMYCVGLNRSQIKADDDYICIRCSKTVAVAAVITGGSNGNSVPAASITTTTTTTLVGNSNSSGVGGAVAAVTQQAQATPSVKGRTQAARLCKSPFQGVMYNCQLCRDWFHEDCVPPPNTSSALNGFNGKPKWLCSSCVRSKRPSLESILPLLVSLQRLPIRLPEDEALRCLAERAMNWQERARKVLTSSDVAAAMEAITAHQRKQKRKNASILPVQARKPRRGSHRNSKDAVTSDNPDTTDDDEEGRLHIVEDGFSNDEDETCDEVAAATAELQKLLPDFEMENLAELMMEGDLLEVSLEDTQTLWRILSMVQPAGASEAAALVKQHQLLQQKQHAQPASSVNSAAEDSNDSLLVQSSPNSNSGSASGRNSSNANKKRRSLDPNGGCTVPRKKTATPNKQPSSVIKKSTRKLQENSKQQPQPDDIGENYTPSKQANGATSGVNAGAQSAQKKRKRVGTNANNNAAGGTGGQKKHSQRTQTAQQEDDEEECRAENCHKPTGREVDWVQCDGGCNEWFHMYCVGLNRSQIKADDDYICIRCSKTVAVAAVITGGSNGNSVPAASITTTTTTTLVGNSNSSGVGGAVAAVTQQAQATPSVKGRTQAARLCKSPFQGVMYNCQLCRDWFHEDCVPPPNTSSALNGFNGKPKWLCSSCVRSKRPSLESILPLLVSLQRLPIRLPEDEALRCLAERAMNWQERARKVLTSSDVAAAMEAITAHQRKQKRKNASILPVQARKPRRGSHRNSKDAVTSDNPDTTDDDEEGRLHIVEDGFSNDEDETCDEVAAATAELQKLLPDFEMENLAELMMEGDLLEVSLEDTQTLWRILSMVQPAGASEAAALVKQHQLLQQKQHAQPASSVNSAAEDSNDSLLVQSSPNSNSGSASGRNSSNANKKRRSLDPNGGCTVPRKKTATPNKQPSSVIKKSTRKLQENSKQQPQPDDIGENYTPSKQANGATSGVNAGAQSAQKKRKRVGTNANNNAAGGTGGQKKHSQRTQTAQQEDDEEECRAENCHKPTGREVDWVQCDGGCNEWFHMYCVGLNRSQIKADDDYICIRCSKTVAVAAVITGGSNGNSVPAASITTTTTTTLVGNSNSSGVGGAVAAVTQQAQATPSVKGRTQAAR